jgi:hypothetical protein
MQIDWYLWGGGAAAGGAAEYADVKMRPLSVSATNGELIGLGALAADAFGWFDRNPRYARAVDGAAGWAAGMLTQGILRRRLVVPTMPTVPVISPQHPSIPASSTKGPTGIPASGGSAAFDLPAGGY